MRNQPFASRSHVNMWLAKTLFVISTIASLSNDTMAQNNYAPQTFGSINFSLGSTTLQPSHAQTVSLYGCNTRITIDGKNWSASDSLEWGKANQILDSVPFGPQYDTVTNDSFYIAKYYIAAPPVINKPLFNIGKVIPDRFTMDTQNQTQSVYFDYTRVKLTQVKFVKVTFDTSFLSTGIKILPINIECDDFPWLDSNKTNEVGAAGIGDLQLSQSANFSGLFLPYYYTNSAHTDSTFLNCEVTILNDIIPYHEIKFEVINGENKYRTDTINLTQLRTARISVVRAGTKNTMPCGCRKPKPGVNCD